MADSMSEVAVRTDINKLICLCKDRREQVAKFLDFMDKQGLFIAPASSVHHNNYHGGLIGHSVNVAKVLLTIKNKMLSANVPYFPTELEWMDFDRKKELPQISDESCVIVGLFHDVHKAYDGFGRQCYVTNVLKSGKVSESKPYEVNKEMMALSGAYRSAMIIAQHIELYEHEIQAIAGHDGQYVPANKEIACKEHPLTLMLHFADMWAAILMEEEDSWLYRKVAEKKFCK